ncbi:MAG: M14 family metallopeptidase [Ideonella sp.]|nr:M14 family metallopeptidase [Ideonella sp.]
MGVETLFSQSYAEARGKFLAAAATAGVAVESHWHPLTGQHGEALALDIVLDGPPEAPNLLIVSSACHGVEGFAGSAVQTRLLGDAGFRTACRTAGVAVLHLHALNPHGFSWWRRTTHENVDLNRNFLDFDAPLPANPGYDEIAHLVVPAQWPPGAQVESELAALIGQRGMPWIQAAISRGQHRHPAGLFYSGTAPTWSHLRLREALRRHGATCARLAWIDVHTGLGPTGVGERIFAWRHDPVALARARRWWGPQVTSVDEGSSTSAMLDGLMWHAVDAECPQAEYTGIALEFGTVPLMPMLDALRADQWLQLHPLAPGAQRVAIKRQLRDAFYVDEPAWKEQVVAQADEAAYQAVAGLAG